MKHLTISNIAELSGITEIVSNNDLCLIEVSDSGTYGTKNNGERVNLGVQFSENDIHQAIVKICVDNALLISNERPMVEHGVRHKFCVNLISTSF